MESRLPEMERSAAEWRDRAMFLNMRGSLAEAEGRHGEAERFYRESLALREQHAPAQNPGIGREAAIVWMNLSYVLAASTRDEAALDAVLRALPRFEKLGAADRPLVIQALDHAGTLYLKLKRFQDAEAFYGRALAMARVTFGPDHIRSGYIMLHDSAALQKLGDEGQAKKMAGEAQAILRQAEREGKTVDVGELMLKKR